MHRRRGWFAAISSPRSSRRRRSGLPLGLLGFAVLVGAAIGFVIADAGAPPSANAGPAGAARVIDGDTLYVGGERVRLWGVDAPERDQSCEDAAGDLYGCGEKATWALSSLVSGRTLTCQERDVDQYGRTVAQCSADGEDLGARLVREGHALDYTRYSRGAYLPDELRARRDKAGVWQGSFSRPEDWRRSGG
ncbi:MULTISPECIES: thermonuclease family protein [unclassified Phenylobacterium]|uniref:thermonuclease family protein n=1 Tax=unclassified Phenylobacterium TaxID=2640670 RepID=UPI0009EAD2C9|nr:MULTISPECIES: thermonuclease family protein [unclassified Phenylobacterium]